MLSMTMAILKLFTYIIIICTSGHVIAEFDGEIYDQDLSTVGALKSHLSTNH